MRKVSVLILAFILIAAINIHANSIETKQAKQSLLQLISLFKQYNRKIEGQTLTEQQKEENKKLNKAIGLIFDYQSLIRGTLRDQWSTMSPDQQNKFFNTFRELVEMVAYNQGSYFYNNSDYTIEEVEKDGEKVRIQTLNHNNDKDLDIDITYIFEKKDQRWVMSDIYMSSRSLVEAYRMQINRIVKKKGLEGLFGVLNKKHAEAKSKEN